MGLGRLPPEYRQYVYSQQLNTADRMLALRSTLWLVSIVFVDLALMRKDAQWHLVAWSMLGLAVIAGAMVLRHIRQRNDYATASRATIVYHGILCLILGLIWVLPMPLLAHGATPAQFIAFWTMTSCLMTAIALGYHSTPLASSSFLLSVGTGAVWLMIQFAQPLLVAVVMTFTLLLLVAVIRQALQFSVQVATHQQLTEKQEVVSLLLKEFDVESADCLWQTDATRRLTDVSPALSQMLGMRREDIEGRSIFEILAGPTWEAGQFDPALHLLAEKFKTRSAFSDLVLPVAVRGKRRWLQISASLRVDEQGTFIGFRGVGSDITVQKESNERIEQMARYDMLTNLPNRLHLREGLASAIEATSRGRKRCGLMMIDLDRFKLVNDTLGHPIGDQLLAQVAQRLLQVCAADQICGRLGGDEFAVVIPDLADAIYMEQLASAIIAAVSQPYVIDDHTLVIGASIGSATAPRDGQDAETLIRSADLAMYRAKEGGGGHYLTYAPTMHADAEERRKLELALRDALANDQLYLAYQPIVDLEHGGVVGFEALARWTHPELGEIPPTKFIPVAEDARLIAPIGNWVLRSACREAMNWPGNVRIAVNVSAEQLHDQGFLETVVSALSYSGLAPSRLVLEVTESVFLRDGSGADQLLEKLDGLGLHLALDDFGTGFSSLGYLSRARFETIKIDRSFVQGAGQDKRECLAIIRAVVAMAGSLAIATIAEGVESEAEYRLMCELGCSKAQGYYFGRPMPADQALGLFGGQASSAVA